MRLAISGPGRAGKDEAANWFVEHCGLRYAGSTSSVIAPYAAERLGLSLAEAWQRRHADRELWRQIGDELRQQDPSYLARQVLRSGDLCVGIRSRGEIEAVVAERMVDLVLWIDRDVPLDPTLEYGREFADVVIDNHWGLPEFHRRLTRFARACGILPG